MKIPLAPIRPEIEMFLAAKLVQNSLFVTGLDRVIPPWPIIVLFNRYLLRLTKYQPPFLNISFHQSSAETTQGLRFI